ncbi:M48 family metalloprotease [Eisenibacter elegans]|uniref:M48 family metalloprotease n=1 Tax=Eisenibacter elegans TaxID=997 RepID=UPI00047B7940|nr:M48 family metalloprotease [Eisenibacter elegans]
MKLMRMRWHLLGMAFLALSLTTCTKDGRINVFSVQDDINLGQQVRAEIAADPQNYPILPESQYPEAYRYLRGLRDKVLRSNAVDYRGRFEYQVFIINDDNVLNAFATPGGYLYFYTGLIKYLETEDELAGVMGHEIAHSDRRHSTTNLTRVYGVSLMLDVVFGRNTGLLGNIAKQLAGTAAGLSFGRGAEREADEYSVIYLSQTEYQCNGAAGFFEKMLAAQGGGNSAPPRWLSTHPPSDERVRDINTKAQSISCSVSPSGINYQAFKNMLP